MKTENSIWFNATKDDLQNCSDLITVATNNLALTFWLSKKNERKNKH